MPSLRDRAQAGHDRDILLAVDLERHRRRVEAGADIDLPQRLHGRVVVGDERAVGEAGEDEAAAGRERAAVLGIGNAHALLDVAGEGIGDDEIGLVALDVPELGALPVAGLGGQLRIERHLVAGRDRGDVEQLGLRAVGRRPIVVAALHRRAQLLGGVRQRLVLLAGIDLDVVVGIVIHRLAGLLVDAFGPVDVLDIGLGQQRLAVAALEGVEEAVARGMGDQLARLPADLAIDEDVRVRLVVVPHVARHILEVPVHVPAVGIPRDHAVGEQVVAGAIGRIEHRHGIAGAPDHLVGRGIVGARDPHGAAADLPGVVLVLPGLAAGLARRRYDVFAPDQLAGGAVERRDPVAHAAVAAGGTNDDLVLDRERRGGDLHVRLVVQVRLPDHLAVVLVGGDHAGGIVGGGDDQIPQQRGAAVRQRQLLLSGVHAPDDAAHVARAHVDLVDHAPLVDDVEEAVLGQWRRLQIFVGRRAADRDGVGELQALDVVLVDLVERRVALRVVGAVVHQPVLRLLVGIDEPIRSHVAGERRTCRERGGAGEQKLTDAVGHGLPPRLFFRWLPARTIGPYRPRPEDERATDRLEA